MPINKDINFTFRMTAEMFGEIKRECKRRDIHRSVFMRLAAENMLMESKKTDSKK
jgi:hypothetical protein